jgi:hypothetical protein
MIAAGYPLAAMLAFIGLHTAIILTGLLALRAADRAAPQPASARGEPQPAT